MTFVPSFIWTFILPHLLHSQLLFMCLGLFLDSWFCSSGLSVHISLSTTLLLAEHNTHFSCCCYCWVALVVSDSVRPHRQQPTRLPRHWDSPGKNTGVGCHFLLQCMKVKSESEVAQSCSTLSDPMDWSLPLRPQWGNWPTSLGHQSTDILKP